MHCRRYAGLAVVLVVLVGACSTPPPMMDACDRVVARLRRCNASTTPCQADAARRQCVANTSLYRGEYVAAIQTCLATDVPCGAAGDDRIETCQDTARVGFTLTDDQRGAIDEFCAVCPAIPQNMSNTDPAMCVAYLTQPMSAARAVVRLKSYNVDGVAIVRRCIAAVPDPGTPNGCAVANSCLSASTSMSMADAGATTCM
jgi:hypothetical protein